MTELPYAIDLNGLSPEKRSDIQKILADRQYPFDFFNNYQAIRVYIPKSESPEILLDLPSSRIEELPPQ